MIPNTPFAALLLAAMLCGCAAEVVRQPSALATASGAPRYAVSENTTSLTLASGYSRTIAGGTEFVEAGRIPQGRVLKPTRTAITVEGAHVHEAYPVVDGGRLVGFYLPVERAFSPLPNPVDFPLKERQ